MGNRIGTFHFTNPATDPMIWMVSREPGHFRAGLWLPVRNKTEAAAHGRISQPWADRRSRNPPWRRKLKFTEAVIEAGLEEFFRDHDPASPIWRRKMPA